MGLLFFSYIKKMLRCFNGCGFFGELGAVRSQLLRDGICVVRHIIMCYVFYNVYGHTGVVNVGKLW